MSVGVIDNLSFAVFQILLLALPGASLTLALFKDREFSPLGFIFVSYALGYALNIAGYFVTAFIGISSVHALIVAGVFTVILVLTAALKIRTDGFCLIRKFSKGDVPYIVLFVLFFAVVVCEYSTRYSVPAADDTIRVYHADALFWVENSAALKKGFPPEEFRLSGTRLYYHYFASVWVAFASLITGIDTFSISYALYPFGKCLLLFGGLYSAALVWFDKERDRILFLLVLLFTTGLEKYSIINYVAHIVTLPFGFDIAHAYGAYFLAGLYLQFREKQFSVCLVVVTAVAFLMCAGHKAPLALIYLVFAGIICFFWLIKKQTGKAFANGISVLVCFAAVMVLCVGFLTGVESRVNAGQFSHCALLRAGPLFEQYEAVALSGASARSKLAAYISSMTKLVLSVHPLVLFLVFTGIVVLIVRKNADIIDAALLATFCVGMCMGLFNAQEGVSQMYYCMAAFVPGTLLGLRNYDYFFGRTPKAAFAMSSAFLIFGGYLFFGSLSEKKADVPTTGASLPGSIQYSDYEALCWIRDNTAVDSVIVSDRSAVLGIDNYMYYGTFSERAEYLEGDRYFYGTYVDERASRRETIKALYENDESALEDVKAVAVDYIIQTKWITPEFEGSGMRKVFETDTVAVWKVE